ncbi:MAG: DUF6364 family protein [Bacteroidia bacterium]
MDTKLTLKINEEVILKAKEYAKDKKTSLSVLIENYLQKLTDDKANKTSITPLVKSLSGVIPVPEIRNDKEEYADYLNNKYK